MVAMAFQGFLAKHLKFTTTAFGPLGAMWIFVWWFLLGAPPGETQGSNPSGAMDYALLLLFRLLVVTALAQLGFMAARGDRLPQVLHACRIRGDLLISILGAFALLPELQLRTDQVLT